ncbi:MFS transporter [Vibrio neptunius]|uniref:MFS transporter n=1 Tax=Vibrio neptunius TaxID=170651 RepID=A0ABS3A3Q7_9VIBR|nr:MFS transporter [Vibrio neptunius]MBN3494300.1 MFS transporter [Vibrio neptunius]MBN3516704.1 MFS transporter [Vibrio neptunius]MBN3550972.1 MFS transporter [Vibrio neptunius]MBN3579111.1 MFS transporter [Vibrio neptunius]MCH9872775.1 MFS transporter [Vibrio neptunius]
MNTAQTTLGLKPLLAVLAGVYTIQSLVGMFTLQGLPAVLRSEGISTSQIGLFYLAMLPWALKFLWAPYVEAMRKRRGLMSHGKLIGFAQLGVVVILTGMALTSAIQLPALLFISVFALALFSTIADISTDGLAVDRLPQRSRHLGNSMQVGGAYIGALFGGGLFIYMMGVYQWQTALYVLMTLIVAMSLPTIALFRKEVPSPQLQIESCHPSLRRAWNSSSVRLGLLMVIVCQIGTRGVQSMMMPYLFDQGLQLTDLGLLAAGGGAITGLIGVLVSAILMKHLSARTMLLTCLSLEALVFACFFLDTLELITSTFHLPILYVLSSAVAAAKFVALYTLMMEWAYGKQAGVDFTLFQSTDMAVAILMALASGIVIANLGYGAHYGIAVIATVIAFGLGIVRLSIPRSSPQPQVT